jgi:AcrR family transcriptional regulator
MSGRDVEILEAACRVIAGVGIRDLRVEDVGHEAGVSPALVYYYFKTKDQLIAKAFAFSDARSVANTQDQLSPSENGRQHVEFVLLQEIADGVAQRENWIMWSETAAAAMFDPTIRSSVERWWKNWAKVIADLIREGQRDGSIPATVDPMDAAETLTAVVDSLGVKWMLGGMTQRAAHRLVRRAIQIELS